MPLRLLEATLPEARATEASGVLERHRAAFLTQERLSEDRVLLRALLDSESTEAATDALSSRFEREPAFRVLIFQVEATVPRVEPEAARRLTPRSARWRVSREELHAGLVEEARLTPVFVASMALSSVIAAIGLARDNVPIIIGAMMIAPLLGPSMALAMGCVLGDLRLVARSSVVVLVGCCIAVGLSMALGFAFDVDPLARELHARTVVSLSDVALALAAGAAGAIAVTTGAPATLIGVMVAVALVPPLVTLGLVLGDGDVSYAPGAAVLSAVNIVGIVFAPILVFLAQGVRPRTWWEADRAKGATRAAIASSTALMLTLIALILAFT